MSAIDEYSRYESLYNDLLEGEVYLPEQKVNQNVKVMLVEDSG